MSFDEKLLDSISDFFFFSGSKEISVNGKSRTDSEHYYCYEVVGNVLSSISWQTYQNKSVICQKYLFMPSSTSFLPSSYNIFFFAKMSVTLMIDSLSGKIFKQKFLQDSWQGHYTLKSQKEELEEKFFRIKKLIYSHNLQSDG